VVDLVASEHNRARDIIESFMVAANTEMAQFLEAEGLPSIRRVVRTPERWPRIVEIARGFGDNLPEEPDSRALSAFLTRRRADDPVHFPDLSLSIVKLMGPGEYVVEGAGADGDGHFGLAVNDYTHSTAPNRRYPDLITQRLLKAVIAHRPPPYTQAELSEIAEHCTEREDAARKVERLMRKASAAVLLGERIGETFDAIVTGVSHKGTFVRLIAPPAEGRVMRGEEGMDVGDKVRVKLLSTEPERGFIDFARAR
jgi:exoribonuclease R